MTSNDDTGTCEYVAYRDRLETWHGEDPEDWYPGDDPDDYWIEGDSWSCPHDALEGSDENFCVFHTDPEDVPESVDEGELLVSTIEEAIAAEEGSEARRKAEFVGSTFGELTLDELSSDREELWLRFDHAVFRGMVTRGAIFFQPVSFFDTKCGFGAVFEGVTFKQDAWFGGATFEEYAGFRQAKFEEYAWFVGTTFKRKAWFVGTTFKRNAWFVEATFQGQAGFSGATFKGQAGFSGTTFEEYAWFREATFDADVRFDEATLEGDARFSRSDFVGGGLSRSTEWPSTTSFERANFTDADLTDASLAGTDLTGAKFSRATLYGTDFSDAKLDGTIFGEAQINERTNFGQFDSGTDEPTEDRASDEADGNDDDATDGSDEETREGDEDSAAERTEVRVTESPLRVVYDPFGGPGTASETEAGLGHRFRRVVNRYRYWHTAAWLNGTDGRPGEDERSESGSERATTDGGTTRAAPHADTHLRKAATTYHVIENLARHNSLPRLQSQAFVRRQEMHRLQYAKKRQFGRWLRASAAQATLLYGESPWRVIGASLSVIFLFGMLYPLGGFREPGSGEVVQAGSVAEWVATLPDGIYFSTLTFTTLGFGDFQPVGWGKWLATMETALGATLIALLVFVLGRRAAR